MQTARKKKHNADKVHAGQSIHDAAVGQARAAVVANGAGNNTDNSCNSDHNDDPMSLALKP